MWSKQITRLLLISVQATMSKQWNMYRREARAASQNLPSPPLLTTHPYFLRHQSSWLEAQRIARMTADEHSRGVWLVWFGGASLCGHAMSEPCQWVTCGSRVGWQGQERLDPVHQWPSTTCGSLGSVSRRFHRLYSVARQVPLLRQHNADDLGAVEVRGLNPLPPVLDPKQEDEAMAWQWLSLVATVVLSCSWKISGMTFNPRKATFVYKSFSYALSKQSFCYFFHVSPFHRINMTWHLNHTLEEWSIQKES